MTRRLRTLSFERWSERPGCERPSARQRQMRQAEQDQRCAVRMALEVSLHRHHLGRLVLQRIEPVQVARQDLQWRRHRHKPHRHRDHHARALVRAIETVVRAPRTKHGELLKWAARKPGAAAVREGWSHASVTDALVMAAARVGFEASAARRLIEAEL